MFCPACGRSLPAIARFCDGCGAALARPDDGGLAVAATATTAGAPPISREIGQEIKARTLDAWAGIKLFAADPVGGLETSYALFDDQRAIRVGIMFGVFYEVAVLFAVNLMGSRLASFGFGFGFSLTDLSATVLFKLVIALAVPFIGLVGASALVRKIFQGRGRLSGDVYTAGATLVPVGLLALVGSLLGGGNVEIGLMLALFGWTYVILILYAGCSRIARVREVAAAPAVPIMLVVSAYLTKVVVAAIL